MTNMTKDEKHYVTHLEGKTFVKINDPKKTKVIYTLSLSMESFLSKELYIRVEWVTHSRTGKPMKKTTVITLRVVLSEIKNGVWILND